MKVYTQKSDFLRHYTSLRIVCDSQPPNRCQLRVIYYEFKQNNCIFTNSIGSRHTTVLTSGGKHTIVLTNGGKPTNVTIVLTNGGKHTIVLTNTAKHTIVLTNGGKHTNVTIVLTNFG